MAELTTQEIAERLARVRPDRYTTGQLDWAADVIEECAASLDAFDAKRRTAEQIVRQIEGNSTRSTNKVMRRYLNEGIAPLDWELTAGMPLSIGGERVCVRALTAHDLREFANDEEDAAESDYRARLDLVKGARQMADDLDAARCFTVADLRAKAVRS